MNRQTQKVREGEQNQGRAEDEVASTENLMRNGFLFLVLGVGTDGGGGEAGEGGQVHNDDDGQVGDAEDEPDVDVLEVGGAGQGVAGLGVEGDEDEQRGEAHRPALVEGLHG